MKSSESRDKCIQRIESPAKSSVKNARSLVAAILLEETLENPNYPYEFKTNLLNSLCEKVSVEELQLKTLLKMLLERSRLREIQMIAQEFQNLRDGSEQKIAVVITSAVPLSENYVKELIQIISQTTGKEIALEQKLDVSLVGGVVTQIGDTVFDGSLRTRMAELKEELAATASGGALAFAGSTNLHAQSEQI